MHRKKWALFLLYFVGFFIPINLGATVEDTINTLSDTRTTTTPSESRPLTPKSNLATTGSLDSKGSLPSKGRLDTPAKFREVTMEESEFWINRPELLKKIEDDRAILVSAKAGDDPDYKSESNSDPKQVLRVSGVALINTPLEFTIKEVSKYESLPKIDERFIEAKYNQAINELFLHGAVFGFHAMMTLRLSIESEVGIHRIRWEVVAGTFKGMKGWIQLREHERQKTEISMTGRYDSAKLPLPEILMGFGLEIVTQRIAGAMRSYLEGEYKRDHSKSLFN